MSEPSLCRHMVAHILDRLVRVSSSPFTSLLWSSNVADMTSSYAGGIQPNDLSDRPNRMQYARGKKKQNMHLYQPQFESRDEIERRECVHEN